MVDYPKIDFQDQYYYARPKSMEEKPKSLDEVDPKLLATYEKLGIPSQRADDPRRRRRRRRFARPRAARSPSMPSSIQRLRRHNLSGRVEKSRGHLLLHLRGDQRIPRPRQKIPRLRRPPVGQLLRHAQQQPSSPTAPSSTSPKAPAARWSSRPTSASTPRTPASSSAR